MINRLCLVAVILLVSQICLSKSVNVSKNGAPDKRSQAMKDDDRLASGSHIHDITPYENLEIIQSNHKFVDPISTAASKYK